MNKDLPIWVQIALENFPRLRTMPRHTKNKENQEYELLIRKFSKNRQLIELETLDNESLFEKAKLINSYIEKHAKISGGDKYQFYYFERFHYGMKKA